MPVENYPLLKRTLNTSVACGWLCEDAKDDFFPDALNFRDVLTFKADYLEQRQHRLLQVDVVPSTMEYVPKGNGMLREAIWLHPSHRILYLAILHHLLPKLDKLVPAAVYSYRLDRADDPDAYPFPNRTDRWKHFHNDFRSAALEESTGAVLLTDLAAFYDHISITGMVQRVEAMLGRSVDDATRSVIQLLGDLLNLWSTTGYGIPQNLDPSSFFGSLYLQFADCDMLGKRYRYFRWVDDIRICAKSHNQAVRALHDLQSVLARDRLFLASDKTRIVEKGTPEFAALLDVEDDVLISNAEEVVAQGERQALVNMSARLLERITHHSQAKGDDRKFRAFANRLLDISEYHELSGDIHPRIRDLVLPRLRSHPSRSDYWTKMLGEVINGDAIEGTRNLLLKQPSLFDWQRYHLWRMLTHADTVPADLLEAAKTSVKVGVSTLERAQCAICVGRHGSNGEREQLFAEHFSAQTPYVIQRALIIATQELPRALRERLWGRALQINTDHRQLVSYLADRERAEYGHYRRPRRECLAEPKALNVFLKVGVGLVQGKRTTFRLSRSHYDYE